MLQGIDHLVVAVRDPDAAAAVLGRELGLAWTGAGRHESMGTFNRLAFLGDTYLELIGVFDRALVRSNPTFAAGGAALGVLDAGREGLATYALATDDVAGDVARLRAAGSRIGPPVAGSRRRPDGEIVRWITAFPALGPDEPPFLIEHEAHGAEWGDVARAARSAFRHPAGGRVRLATLEFPVVDPAATATRYATETGMMFDAAGVARVGGQEIRLRAADGGPVVVTMAGEPGSPGADVVRFGVRWRRHPAAEHDAGSAMAGVNPAGGAPQTPAPEGS